MAKAEKVKKEKELIQPVIKVEIQAAKVMQAETKSTNDIYHLVALRKDGSEKIGSDFTCTSKTFEKQYKRLTEKPDGEAEKDARFRVKKNLKQ